MASTSSKNAAQTANALWSKQAKTNSELFALTYGALVAELLRDLEDPSKITEELDRMGHSIGVRCIEEVLAKAATDSVSQNFSESADILKIAFRMFLGVIIETRNISDTSYAVTISENPLTIFVELPPNTKIEYSQILAGMVRGMLEMLQFDVSARVTSTVLTGGETNEIVVDLKQILQEGAGEDYQDE
jgi:hypothetical protein